MMNAVMGPGSLCSHSTPTGPSGPGPGMTPVKPAPPW